MNRTDGTGDVTTTPWWRTWRVGWLVAIAALLTLLAVVVVEKASRVAPLRYSAFLDQLEAGNVASATFQGNEISGRFKRPLDDTAASGTLRGDTFDTRVPEIGDPTLVPELRTQHVPIDVHVPSLWTSVLSRLPWPMLAFLGAMAVAGLFRVLRGGSPNSGSAGSAIPAHGMMGLISGLLAKRRKSADPVARNADTKRGQ
jgi:ATP-dependent Zn protease